MSQACSRAGTLHTHIVTRDLCGVVSPVSQMKKLDPQRGGGTCSRSPSPSRSFLPHCLPRQLQGRWVWPKQGRALAFQCSQAGCLTGHSWPS